MTCQLCGACERCGCGQCRCSEETFESVFADELKQVQKLEESWKELQEIIGEIMVEHDAIMTRLKECSLGVNSNDNARHAQQKESGARGTETPPG